MDFIDLDHTYCQTKNIKLYKGWNSSLKIRQKIYRN